jgi:hypothetical protein
MNEINKAIFDTLKAGTALTSLLAGGTAGTAIYNQQPPDNSTMPYVIFNRMGGGPDNNTPSDSRSYLYFVRAYVGGTSPTALAGTIDAQISALLHRKTLSVSGYTNYWTVRESDAPQTVDNLPSGERAYQSGAFYRIKIDT